MMGESEKSTHVMSLWQSLQGSSSSSGQQESFISFLIHLYNRAQDSFSAFIRISSKRVFLQGNEWAEMMNLVEIRLIANECILECDRFLADKPTVLGKAAVNSLLAFIHYYLYS